MLKWGTICLEGMCNQTLTDRGLEGGKIIPLLVLTIICRSNISGIEDPM